jgi:DNA-directed RNA polymerase specialized sigma24 family protein
MGYSPQEIAFITDSQVETVELRMDQARGQLRRYLTTLDKELSISNNLCPLVPSECID